MWGRETSSQDLATSFPCKGTPTTTTHNPSVAPSEVPTSGWHEAKANQKTWILFVLFQGTTTKGTQGLLQDGSEVSDLWSGGGGGGVGGEVRGNKKEGGPWLSSVRPWWDLCRGARYTAFRRVSGTAFFFFFFHVGWELLIFSKTEFFFPRIEIMDHT